MSLPMRQASLTRTTKETEITLSLNLDGTGKSSLKTGVGFFDHMIEQIARHGLFDLEVNCKGDVHIDDHHTVEDVGIVLGQAFRKSLGEMKGITRYADTHLAMDETLTRVAVDISGRAFLVFKTQFHTSKIGTFDTQLVREFFQAFAMNAGITLHIETLYGENDHHIAESCFKGVARALRQAVSQDPRIAGIVPSSKGSL
jgi:imidazoleglycerol-phosphate dehydratase